MYFKKFLIRTSATLLILVGLLLAVANWGLGYSPSYLYNAPAVATGIGAKLACSAHFVSGFNEQKTAQDIEVYSPILGLLDYNYDKNQKTVSASLLGVKTRSASYIDGLGCALDYAYDDRQGLTWPNLQSHQAAWPKGNVVFTIDADKQAKLDAIIEADNADGHDTRALVVVHKGKIVAESYADGMNESTPLLGWSMTKSVNSLIAGHLEMVGAINISETELFRDWAKDERADITFKNLLQMTDGLNFDETYDPGHAATKMLFQVPSASEFTLKRGLRYKPGTINNYSSGTANLIAALVQQRIEGDKQADIDYIVDSFFRPMGLTSATYEMDSSANLIGSSYMFATGRDWARIGQLMLNGGELNGRRLVTESWVQRSVESNDSKNDQAYGYQWWLNTNSADPIWPDLPSNTYSAMGNRAQRVLVIPDEELVIVRLGWSPKAYIDNDNFKAIHSWFK